MSLPLSAIGTTLAARYRLDSLLGEGGMGIVFSARDLMLERRVAVKIIRPEYSSDHALITRFIREAKIFAQLATNPHILTIYDLGQSNDWNPFIVAEYLQGRSLKVLMSREHRPSRTWVVEVGVQVALALVDIHRHGITHRDIKPSNIFIVEAPGLALLTKVIDFGLSQSPQYAVAQPRDSEIIGGTIRYLPPETINGEEPTAAADVYSFGIMLYELATGAYPYAAVSREQIFSAHRWEAPRPFPEERVPFPMSFQTFVMQMLSKKAVERPSTERCLKALRETNKELDALRIHAQ